MFCKGVHVLLHICNILFCLNLGEDWKYASKQKMCTNDYQMKLWQQTHPSTNINNIAKSHSKKCATTVDHIWTTSRATRNQNIRVAAMQHPATLPLRLSYLNQKRNDVFSKEFWWLQPSRRSCFLHKVACALCISAAPLDNRKNRTTATNKQTNIYTQAFVGWAEIQQNTCKKFFCKFAKTVVWFLTNAMRTHVAQNARGKITKHCKL